MTAPVKVETEFSDNGVQAGLKKVGTSMTELNQGMEVVKKAAAMMGEAYQALVGDLLAYSDQVRDLSRVTGASTEESSRLIQVADDLQVEYGSLTAAAKALAKDGIALTTEELAKASDEYLAITDAGARAEFAVTKFGRAGLELTKILEQGGDALREMASGQAENLVLTAQQTKAARDLEIAQDELEDTVKGLQFAFANWLVPALNEAYAAVKNLAAMQEGYSDILKKHSADVAKSTKTYEEYAREMIRVDGVKKGAASTDAVVSERMRRLGDDLSHNVKMLGFMTRAEWDAAQGADVLTERITSQRPEVQGLSADLSDLTLALQNEEGAYYDTGSAVKALTQAQKDLNAANLSLINDSMKPLTAEMLYQKAAVGLDAGAALELARSMGLVNETTYTALSKLAELRTQFDSNRDGMIDATEAANGFTDAVQALATGNYLVTIRADFSDLERALSMAAQLNAMGTAGIKGPTFSWTPTPGGAPTPTPPPTPPTPPGPGGWGSGGTPGGATADTVININGWQGDGKSLASEIDRQLEIRRLFQ